MERTAPGIVSHIEAGIALQQILLALRITRIQLVCQHGKRAAQVNTCLPGLGLRLIGKRVEIEVVQEQLPLGELLGCFSFFHFRHFVIPPLPDDRRSSQAEHRWSRRSLPGRRS